MKRSSLLLIILFTWSLNAFCQPQDSLKKKRLRPLIIGTGAVYTASLIGLNKLWYKDFERQSFQFFDDSDEWKQVDKLGHFYSGFHISHAGYKGLEWAGVEENKAILWGSITSFLVLTPIEIFDGFSAEYGASYSDVIANTAGTALFLGQQKLWGEIKIHPKFSFHRTSYPDVRPELLGSSLHEEILKDYNGQTYWLSFDISKMVSGKFPKWLNIAIGYGADGMVSANDESNEALGYNPVRQYFLAIDFDLNEYKTNSKFLNTLIYFINMVRLPAPALEFGSELKFHLAYH